MLLKKCRKKKHSNLVIVICYNYLFNPLSVFPRYSCSSEYCICTWWCDDALGSWINKLLRSNVNFNEMRRQFQIYSNLAFVAQKDGSYLIWGGIESDISAFHLIWLRVWEEYDAWLIVQAFWTPPVLLNIYLISATFNFSVQSSSVFKEKKKSDKELSFI